MSYKITDDCTCCGNCADECPIEAIKQEENIYVIDQEFCTECGDCFYVCDADAIVHEFTL